MASSSSSTTPETGVMETEWAENRAKIPQDGIRALLGRVFDSLYSTGERDKFRTRVERSPSGGSEVYITHRGMEEVYTNAFAGPDQVAAAASPTRSSRPSSCRA